MAAVLGQLGKRKFSSILECKTQIRMMAATRTKTIIFVGSSMEPKPISRSLDEM